MEISRFIIEFGGRLAGHFREKAFTQNPEQARVRLRFIASQGGGCFPSAVSGLRFFVYMGKWLWCFCIVALCFYCFR